MSWPGDIESVTITWMDGQQETYKCTRFTVANGELRLWSQYQGGADPDRRYDERGFPQATMRTYVVNRVEI